MDGGQEWREIDRRLDRLEQDMRDFTSAHSEERTQIHEDLSSQRAGLEGHERACTERWKANDAKWADNDKRHDGMSTKLNAIIAATFGTLLTVCGFFIALWIERQDDRAARREATAPAVVSHR